MKSNIVLFFISVIVILFFAAVDGSSASLAASAFILFAGTQLCFSAKKSYRSGAFRTFLIVLPIYLVSAYMFSMSFDQTRFFAVSDPMRYLQFYQNSTNYFDGWYNLHDSYLNFTDDNGLYNSYLQLWGAIGSNIFGGSTVYSMTLAQTLFGVLCSVALYKVLSRLYPEKSVFYTVVFSCCSLLLFYSSVIIRDIIIVFYFIYALDYLTQDFKLYRFFVLIAFGFVVWGVRLYSGLFYFIFPLSYITLWLTKRLKKRSAIAVSIIMAGIMVSIAFATAVGEQTLEEINTYEEFSADRNENGLFTKLTQLPPVVKQVSLTLFSQIMPFPPYSLLLSAKNISQAYMGLDHVVYEVFWFFVFFMCAYLVIISGKYRLLKREDLILILISLMFVVVNTAHPDIRRMMPVYPMIYMVFLNVVKMSSQRELSNAKMVLVTLYFALLAFAMFYRA